MRLLPGLSGRSLAAAVMIAAASCRTAHVNGPEIAPLSSAVAVPIEELHARADAFPGARSVLRMRVTTGEQSRSFRGQLIVRDRKTMDLIAYTPVGTTAATIHADGDQATVTDSINGTTTTGSATDMLRQYGFFTGGLTPAEMGMLLLGYPPRRDLVYETAATGLSRATAGDVVVTFDPPVFPAQHVLVSHGEDRVEIDHLEIAAMQ